MTAYSQSFFDWQLPESLRSAQQTDMHVRRGPSRLRIIVLGYIVRGPIGGLVWHHLQYVMGLAKLGHDVYFVEDSGDSPWCCYDPGRHVTDSDPSFGLKFAGEVFQL